MAFVAVAAGERGPDPHGGHERGDEERLTDEVANPRIAWLPNPRVIPQASTVAPRPAIAG